MWPWLIWHCVGHTRVVESRPPQRTRCVPGPVSWTGPALRCLVALGLVVLLITLGIGAASTAWGSPVLPYFEACCLVPVVIVVILELRPALIALWNAPRGSLGAIRRFRRELDALPETQHPLGA